MFTSLTHIIGNTPLIKLQTSHKASILAKLEYLNPGGSIKDRVALRIFEQAESKGLLKPGGTIIDVMSSNVAISMAMLGASKGYRTIICLNEKTSLEKIDILKAYGAHVVVSSSGDILHETTADAYAHIMQLHKEIPNSFIPSQHSPPENESTYYKSLAYEIWEQTQGTVTHFFALVQKDCYLDEIGSFLKEKNQEIKIIALTTNNIMENIELNCKSLLPQDTTVDEIMQVQRKDAVAMLPLLAQQQGLLVGPSSGAVAWAAQHYIQKLNNAKAVCCIIFDDSGRDYVSQKLYQEISSHHEVMHQETAINLNTKEL